MKKLITILLVLVSVSASSQQITLDSLTKLVKSMQLQITELQKKDTIAFVPAQVTVTKNSAYKQTVSINNYTAMATSAAVATKASADVATLTTQLSAATTRIAALEVKLAALQNKVLALKVTITSTGVIQ